MSNGNGRALGPNLAGSIPSETRLTVALAFGANVLIALAKTAAAAVTGSASLVAEAAHSWADSGNEVLLLVANHRSARTADDAHPVGFGREAYVWSMVAAIGLFVMGGAVSVTHGVQELLHPEPAESFSIGYAVLAIAAALEGVSFLQSTRQAKREASELDRALAEHVLRTSDPTLRAVFAEDAAALIGLAIAGTGLALHQATGSPTPDAVGSIVIGLLLGGTAFALIEVNRRFLVGQEADPRVRSAVIRSLLSDPDVARVTYLRLEFVGPRLLSITGAVDLCGDESESDVAVRLRRLEARLDESPSVVGSVLSLSAPDEPSLTG